MIKWLAQNNRGFGGIFLILFLSPVSLLAQLDLQDYKSKYPGNHIVQLFREETIRLDVVKGKLVAKQDVNEEYLLLNNEGGSIYSEEVIYFSSFETVEKINAYSYQITDKSRKKRPATNFVTRNSQMDENIFHDDQKETSFIYPGLREGSVKHVSYTLNLLEPHFPFGLPFFTYYPLEKNVFKIDHDTSVHLIKYEYNFDGFDIDFKEEIIKNRRIWTWTSTKVPEYKTESNAPKAVHYLPIVYAQISHYNKKGQRENIIGSLDDLVSWYSKNADTILNEVPSASLKELTGSIIKDIDSEIGKVQAIYYWVQDNIKYIAFSDGMEGFIPRRANLVCERRFGDCKDMSVLIYKMLEIAGIKGHVVWIGTKQIPLKYTEFPSTAVDNHMIAAYIADGEIIYLDGTSDFQPLKLPPFSLQGKESLVYSSRSNYFIDTVAIPDASLTTMNDRIDLNFENKKLKGKGSRTISGYYNWLVRVNISYMSDLQSNKKLEKLWSLGNNSYKVTESNIKNSEDRDVPLEFDYVFEVDNYVTSYNSETFVNMVLQKNIYKEKQLKPTRISPFYMDFKSNDNYEVVLHIPAGMKVKSVPESVEYKNEKIEFSCNYEIKDDTVILNMSSVFNFLSLQPEEFHLWNDFVSVADKVIGSSVVLIKDN